VSGENIKTEQIFNWNDIRRDIQNETPNPRDFGGGEPYSDETVVKDLEVVEQFKSSPQYRHEKGIKDSEVQEYATAQEIGEMDWFGEELRRDELFPGRKGSDTCTFMASEFDDLFNHVDAVCLMNNACSDFKPVPFALDLTYNGGSEELDRKFAKHSLKHLTPMGFTTVKYFEDTFNSEPLLPKGRIDLLPRFIVGFSPDLSNKITEERMTNTGWGALSREEPSNEAKFCVLRELKVQSEQMLEWLGEHHKDSQELRRMYRDVTALDKFFGGALKTAREHDTHGFEAYSERDSVVQQIMSRNIVRGK